MDDSLLEGRRRRGVKKKRKQMEEEEKGRASESEEEEEAGVELEIDRQLDQSLETKSRQHNLTTVNVRNILHEVITNEHVVAMMKAAINETEAVPPFEPKMTRSKFKEVVEKGVVIPAWNISPIKKSSDVIKAPQFVDIPLAEEDSSDEEYCPDEDEEDETAEDTFQESDIESTASSPRGSRLHRGEEDSSSPWQTSRSRSRRVRVGSVSMGPPPPPKALPPKAVTDSSFLEKLHAVEEELAVCMEPYQPLSESEDEVGLMAYRTRSKRPLRDVPLGQLEAELRAPDITPDMYDSSSAHEDREWTDWLRGLMSSDVDNEEECDDEDDPEYNFLADIDEPDQEDYRDDKAVRITKKEVNELMEELFETLKEDLAGQEVDDDGHEEEEEPRAIQTHTCEEQQRIQPHGDEVEVGPVTELRTVKQQLEFLKKRRQAHTVLDTHSHTHMTEPHTLKLNTQQRMRLQTQLQQHVQLLTQIHLLTSPVTKLQSEAETTRQFLFELELLAQRGELLMSSISPGFCSIFRASNLQEALTLLEELRQAPVRCPPQECAPDARGYMRRFPVMPAELAWIFATRPVFLYPELLPCVSLDPSLYCPRRTATFSAAEDCLLVLGLRNMEGSCDPTKLVSEFLLRKTLVQVRRRILQCCRPGSPDNIVKAFRYQRLLWPMAVACRRADAAERRPPVEREESIMPLWLVRSLPVIYRAIKHLNAPLGSVPEAPPPSRSGRGRQSQTLLRSSSYSFPAGTRYPPRLPTNLDFRRVGFILLQPPLPRPHPASSHLTDRPVDPSTVSMTIRQQISRHYLTLASLKRRSAGEEFTLKEGGVTKGGLTPSPSDSPAPSQVEVQENSDVIDGEEEESDVMLALSESSPSSPGDDLPDPEEAESETEQEMILMASTEGGGGTSSDECGAPADQQGEPPSEGAEDDDGDQSEVEDVAFAQDYLVRVCNAVAASPARAEQLLRVLDQFSSAGPLEASGDPERLYDRLSSVLQPWPQLLRDFAAFLNRAQAQRCGLLVEQQTFEHSRQFLRRLGRSLGEDSSLYQQVVSVLQGSSTPSPEHIEKISALLKHHPDLQQELKGLFLHLRTQSPPVAANSETTETNCISQNPPDKPRERMDKQTFGESEMGQGAWEEEEPERALRAKNISMGSNGEKLVVWTREADRTILTACQQGGANQRTFRRVSAQLGDKTAQQVTCRFQDLMTLFYSATRKSTSCSSESQPIRREAAPD
ncbi:GON-4-like protein [Aulostomus maculatus]